MNLCDVCSGRLCLTFACRLRDSSSRGPSRNHIDVAEGLLLFGLPDVQPCLFVITYKLDEMSFLDELFNDNFKLEAILGIMAMVLMVSAVLVSIPFLGRALQFARLL